MELAKIWTSSVLVWSCSTARVRITFLFITPLSSGYTVAGLSHKARE
jgi:hypothetical protein